MLGEIWLIFALDPKLNSAAETLPLQPGPKFLCFVVHFFEKVWFWCQTKIVPENVYAWIWPVLEITSLNKMLIAIKKTNFSQFSFEILITYYFSGLSKELVSQVSIKPFILLYHPMLYEKANSYLNTSEPLIWISLNPSNFETTVWASNDFPQPEGPKIKNPEYVFWDFLIRLIIISSSLS